MPVGGSGVLERTGLPLALLSGLAWGACRSESEPPRTSDAGGHAAAQTGDGATAPSAERLRVVTWNIKGAQLASAERLAEKLRALQPDVVGLQEVFFDARWNGHVDLAEELGRLTGLRYQTLVTIDQDDARGPFGAEVGGLAVLTREDGGEVTPLEAITLASGQRLAARFGYRGIDFVVAHLPVEAERRAEGLRTLAELSWSSTAILMGDFNTTDVSLAGAPFDVCADCGVTYPARAPSRRIDWIVGRGLGCGRCSTVRVTASDHLPVVVSFGGEHDPVEYNPAEYNPVEYNPVEPEVALIRVEFPALATAPGVSSSWLAALPASFSSSQAPYLRAAVVDPTTPDALGHPRPIDDALLTLRAGELTTELCTASHPGTYQPCSTLNRQAAVAASLVLETESGVANLHVTPSEAHATFAISVDSVAPTSERPLGAPLFVPVEELPQQTPPGMEDELPRHPRHRRIDVHLTPFEEGDPAWRLFVTVLRVAWSNGNWHPDPTPRFSDLPNTAEDVFDELHRTPITRVSIPGTAFDAPGVYFILASTLRASAATEGLGPRSGALTGQSSVSALWVE